MIDNSDIYTKNVRRGGLALLRRLRTLRRVQGHSGITLRPPAVYAEGLASLGTVLSDGIAHSR